MPHAPGDLWFEPGFPRPRVRVLRVGTCPELAVGGYRFLYSKRVISHMRRAPYLALRNGLVELHWAAACALPNACVAGAARRSAAWRQNRASAKRSEVYVAQRA